MATSTQKQNKFWGFPATGSNISNFANAVRAKHTEQTYRETLVVEGIPSDARACTTHRQMLQQQGSSSRGQPDSLVSTSALDLADLASTTALLPHCTLCFLAQHPYLQPPHLSSIPPCVDLCTCATSISTADCIYCTLDTIHTRLESAIATRTRRDPEGFAFLACECGSQHVCLRDLGELVRKCVGCGGMVTAPWRNWEREEVVFGIKTRDVTVVFPTDLGGVGAGAGVGRGLMKRPRSPVSLVGRENGQAESGQKESGNEERDWRLRDTRPTMQAVSIAPRRLMKTTPATRAETNTVSRLTNNLIRKPTAPAGPSSAANRHQPVTEKAPLQDITHRANYNRGQRSCQSSAQGVGGRRSGMMPPPLAEGVPSQYTPYSGDHGDRTRYDVHG